MQLFLFNYLSTYIYKIAFYLYKNVIIIIFKIDFNKISNLLIILNLKLFLF